MTALWIAGVVGAAIIVVFFVTRRRGGSIEFGTMSESWIAEQRSGEHSYTER